MNFWYGWPYAAKAAIQHALTGSVLLIYVTFRFPMETGNKPALAKWKCTIDGVPKNVANSAWLDQWTLVLAIINIGTPPITVYVEYDGPDPNLATTWKKQWEPWGAIRSEELDITPKSKILSTGPAPQDDVDVTGITVLFLDCSANDVVIGGFVGGTNGQVLHIARLCAAANDATLEHNEGTANQNIFLHAGADESLTGEYGGWALACDGDDWYDVSHAKHV